MPPADRGMTCRELVDRVTDHAEGALPALEWLAFETHLRGCAGCRTYVEQMRRTVELTRQLKDEPLDPRLADELLGIFRRWKAGGARA